MFSRAEKACVAFAPGFSVLTARFPFVDKASPLVVAPTTLNGAPVPAAIGWTSGLRDSACLSSSAEEGGGYEKFLISFKFFDILMHFAPQVSSEETNDLYSFEAYLPKDKFDPFVHPFDTPEIYSVSKELISLYHRLTPCNAHHCLYPGIWGRRHQQHREIVFPYIASRKARHLRG